MELFSASSAWSWILLFTVLLGSLLLGNVLKKLIKPLKNSLIPTSVLGGAILLIVAAIFKTITGHVMFDTAVFGGHGTDTLEIITYHALAIGFIASSFKTTGGKLTKKRSIEIFDTGVAFLAGLMIIPAVFSFSGGDESALGKGPGLMFVTLPKVFDAMPGGTVIGAAFFIMVLLAALTSSISLMETIVSIFMDKLKLDRKVSCLIVLGISVLLGVPSSLGYSAWSELKILGMQVLDFFDFASNNIMMPLIALVTCIFVSFFIKPKTVIDEVELSGKFKWRGLFAVVIKYIAPVCILVILVSSVLSAFGVLEI